VIEIAGRTDLNGYLQRGFTQTGPLTFTKAANDLIELAI
jgi:hypothetical protein